MKKLLILLILVSCNLWAQNKNTLEKLLNNELNKELKIRMNNSYYYEGDTLIVVEPFKIENKVLSITVKKKSYYDNSFYTEKQEVALDKITSIIKDINVIFETKTDAVTVTQTNTEGETTTSNYHLFFLHLSADKDNESLANEITKSFKKEGYSIGKGFWLD